MTAAVISMNNSNSGSNVRIEIIKLLIENKEMNMNELAAKLNITNGALTGHIKKLEACGMTDKARVVNGDAMSYLKSGEKFDLIFLDPPYASGLLEQALEEIVRFDICRRHGIIVAESAADKTLPALAGPYALHREYRYGKIKLTVYHRDGNED